ncbi:hypothetical protein Clacol_006915 [Clathrus columnatus]|uniref:FAD/NAD(P)-binding domain-containing protein n=1 Tax=Clathrus columnatus TaxID=1419009 RepID=A0AAV5AIA3_9AGAM|nr:hypothetical protein Clacol_006915 [Clathrus columnatus]
MSSKHVVVIGGGSAGTGLVQALSTKLASTEHRITLVTEKEYYPHYISALRAFSGPISDTEWPESTLLPLDRLLANKNGKLIIAKATSIEYDHEIKSGKGNVITDKGDRIPFDVLAIATGSHWESPLDFGSTKKAALQQISDWREKIKHAKGVVLVGGGAVGIGESKPITLVHNKSLLLNPTYPDKFRRDLANRLEKQNIHLVLDDSIDVENTRDEIVTSKGFRVNGDLLIPTRGPRANPALLETLSPAPITSSGHAAVEATLQIKGYPNIFALGDVISFEGEIPQKAKHGGHIAVVSSNILDALAGREPQAKYTKSFEGIFVTIGKNNGAGYVGVWWGLMFGGWVVKILKGKTLFVGMVKKSLGY